MAYFRSGLSSGGEDFSFTALVNGSETVQTSVANCFASNGAIKNENIIIGDNVYNCANMFYYAQNFNGNVIIGNNVNNCYSMFSGASNLNRPILIPKNVVDVLSMFSAATKLNENVIFETGSKANTFENFFRNEWIFNKPVSIPPLAQSCYQAFQDAYNFNQEIVIPLNVRTCNNMFTNCKNMRSNIYINNSNGIFVTNMFKNHYNHYRKNIFINNAQSITTGYNTGTGSIVGAGITWSTMTNGYYNAYHNIYVYNNYTGNT